MAKNLYLPKGYELKDRSRIHKCCFLGDDWQIYETNGTENILVVKPTLADKWVSEGLIDSLLVEKITFGKSSYNILFSRKKFILHPVGIANFHPSKRVAISFASALYNSRKISQGSSFHDAIFIEQHACLLPTWTTSQYIEDEMVLGCWLTGGVRISIKSFQRLTSLLGWMSLAEVAEVISAAGFQVEKNIERLNSNLAHSGKKTGQTPSTPFKLPGRPKLESFFNEHVIDIILHPDKYESLGIGFPSAIVLHGPPGCGKTFAVEKLVEFLGWPSFSIDSSSVGSSFIHETSKKISEVMSQAIDAAPSVVVIDEMEAFLSDRQAGGFVNTSRVEEVSEFLRQIPRAIKSKVLIIGMTNLINLIDKAILRRGRFDHVIEVGMPSRSEVSMLIDFLLRELPKSKELDLDSILDKLAEKPLSDSSFLIREAGRCAASNNKREIDQESLSTALLTLNRKIDKVKPSIGFNTD